MRRRPVVGVLAAALLLAGCTGGGDGDPSPSGSSTKDRAASPTPSESGDASPDADAVESDGATCLVGEWDSDMSALASTMEEALAEYGGTATSTVTGDSVLTFDGSTLQGTYSDFTIVVNIDVEGQEMVMTIAMDGTASGEYTATDTALTVASFDTSAITQKITVTVGGEDLDIPTDSLGDVAGEADNGLLGTSTYVCTDDELRTTPDIEGGDEFTQVLTRR